MAAPASGGKTGNDFAHPEELVDPSTGPSPSRDPPTTTIEKIPWLNNDHLALVDSQDIPLLLTQMGDQAWQDINFALTDSMVRLNGNLGDETKNLEDNWVSCNSICDDIFQASGTIAPPEAGFLTQIQQSFPSIEAYPVLTPFMANSLHALKPNTDSQSDLSYDDLQSSSPISSSPIIFSSSPFASSQSSQASEKSCKSKLADNGDAEISFFLETFESKECNYSYASSAAEISNQRNCETETETEMELEEMTSSLRSAMLVSSSSYDVGSPFSPSPLSLTSEYPESPPASSHSKINHERLETNAGSIFIGRSTHSEGELNFDSPLQSDSVDNKLSATANPPDPSPSKELIGSLYLTASSNSNTDFISVNKFIGLDLCEVQGKYTEQIKSEETTTSFEKNDNQSHETAQEGPMLVDNIVEEDAGQFNVKERRERMDLMFEFSHLQNDTLESKVPLHQTSFPARLPSTAVKRKRDDCEEQLLMSDITPQRLEDPHIEIKAASHTISPDAPKLECSLPLPKRATLASQKLQHKKLATPFRSPVMKKGKLDPQVQPGIKLNPASVFHSDKETITETVDPKNGEVIIVKPTLPEKSDSKIRHRTVRAAAQFKSPLNASSLPNTMPSVRLTPTIQGLEMKLQNLKRALKVRQDKQEEVLENLIQKWTVAGREVAWEVWSLVKDNSSDEVGWGINQGKGTKRRFEDGWGWEDRGKEGKKERERHWGWNVVPQTEDVQEMVDIDDDAPILQQEDEEEPKPRGTLGMMLIQLTIDPATLGWSEDEGAFVDD